MSTVEIPSPIQPARTGVQIPLVVDLDGTLIRADLLIESFFALLASSPLAALRSLGALRSGKAALKARIADEAILDLHTLPFNETVLDFIRAEKAKGRKIYLASASDQRYLVSLAEHLGLFDGVFGSEPGRNLAGAAKAELLVKEFGRGGFDYAGNADVDLAVWEHARNVVVVNAASGLIAKVHKRFADREVVSLTPRSVSIRHYVKALRAHQWLKNVLVFVPSLAAHHFDLAGLATGVLAFLGFNLCASSVYLLNDMVDLRSDRLHHSKRRRPFASGAVPLHHGLVLQPLLLLGAAGIASALPWRYAVVMAGYYVMTLGYSFYLKRRAIMDVVTLACLYGVRLVAGSAAAAVPLSPWLVAFSIFLFFSLALVKRITELLENIRRNKEDPAGRGYQRTDVPILEAMAAASAYMAVVVMALYVNSPAVTELYRTPHSLWAICVAILIWVSRVLLMTHRGQMHDDPLVFAAKDRFSLATGLIVVAIVAASI
jgi:4-hydroxybenzoate polyprenyltransferase/phosphoserine phosphatase